MSFAIDNGDLKTLNIVYESIYNFGLFLDHSKYYLILDFLSKSVYPDNDSNTPS